MFALTLKKSQGVYMWVNDTGYLRKFNKKNKSMARKVPNLAVRAQLIGQMADSHLNTIHSLHVKKNCTHS